MSDIEVSELKFRTSNDRVRPYVEIVYPATTTTHPYRNTILGYSCPEDVKSPSLRALFWDRGGMLCEAFERSTIKIRP